MLSEVAGVQLKTAAIQLAAGHSLQVVAQSVWARPEYGGLFSVGVKFLCRLGAGAA